MATLLAAEPRLEPALKACITALRGLAEYELAPALSERLLEMSENKEFLDCDQHDQLLALVEFTQQRSKEKLEAQAALQRLREIIPEMVPAL